MGLLSVVVPLKDEQANVRPLVERVRESLRDCGPWELVLVDDGSTDGTFAELEAAAADPRVKVIRLRRNFGQSAATQAGLDAAAGDVIVTMDGDLQNDPADIPRLLERLDQQRTLLRDLLAEHLPEARMRPLEATYMAWLDLRAYGHEDPAAMLLSGGVRVSPGEIYWPGTAGQGHVRLNIATSPDRLTEIVRRMAAALTD